MMSNATRNMTNAIFIHLALPVSLAVLASLGACTGMETRQDSSATADVPEKWSLDLGSAGTGSDNIAARQDSGSLAQWWERFNDPVLSDLVTQALQANTSVTSAEASLRLARSLQDVAAAARWPVLDGSATAGRSKSGHANAIRAYTAGLDASWELDIFGANRSALNSAEANTQASMASLGDVQVSTTAEVALDYIILRSTQARLTIANNNLASQQETLQITQWRAQAGLANALDTEQARTVAAQTQALIPPLQTTIEQTRHAIAVLTGKAPAALATQLAEVAPTPHAGDGLTLNIPAETLRQRPDVRAAERLVAAARATLAEADAARYPSFTLSGTLGLGAARLTEMGDGTSILSSVLAGVTVPLFNAGSLRAQVRARQAELDIASASYRAAILAALMDVENSLVALRGDREHLLRLQNAAEAATNAALLARQRYGSGLVDFQTVLDTQRTQLSTQDSVATAEADLGSDHVRLYKALGGGWNANAATASSEASSEVSPNATPALPQ